MLGCMTKFPRSPRSDIQYLGQGWFSLWIMINLVSRLSSVFWIWGGQFTEVIKVICCILCMQLSKNVSSKFHETMEKLDELVRIWFMYLAWPCTCVCTKFQVDGSKTFGLITQKTNFIFVTSLTLKLEVTVPNSIGSLRGQSYMPCFKLTVKLFEILHRNGIGQLWWKSRSSFQNKYQSWEVSEQAVYHLSNWYLWNSEISCRNGCYRTGMPVERLMDRQHHDIIHGTAIYIKGHL